MADRTTVDGTGFTADQTGVTVDSGPMIFANGSDLMARHDLRLIADLATDANETLPQQDIADHPNVLAALEDASSEIAVSLQTGGRYTVEQLEKLSGYNLAHLKRITCDIAMYLLVRRRPIMDEQRTEGFAKQSREHLNRLARGENVFGITDETNDEITVQDGNLELITPSVIDIEGLNLLPGRMGRFFPGTAQRSPRNW